MKILIGFALGLALAAAAILGSRAFDLSTVHTAYGVVSQCGVYAVIVVKHDGTSTLYSLTDETPDNDEVPESLVTEINALPETGRPAIIVPCPPVVLGVPHGLEL